jgi:radical SAM protein with 4Fe4S-binding SPASM domain
MLYKQKHSTFIRIYDDVGYILSKDDYGDRIFDSSGAVFLKALSRKGQTIDTIIDNISTSFINIDKETLRKDAADFLEMLEEDGFIVSGETEHELDIKDVGFSYARLKELPAELPIKLRSPMSTRDFMESHFRENPKLTSFQIELTSRCNERCIHCYIPHERKNYDIDTALYNNVLEQCHDLGVLNLTLSGGEPMLHPHFAEFLHMAKKYDLSVNILSNLTLLDDTILTEMKENRLCSVQVSLYSMDAKIHDSITKLPGSFSKTKTSILKLIESDIPVQLNCISMRKNKDSYPEVLKWGEEHKMRTETDFVIMARYDRTTDNLDNRLDLNEVEEVITSIINKNKNYQDYINRSNFVDYDSRDISEDPVCSACFSTISMVADGTIYPCPGWQKYVCGNVCNNSLHDIWENSPQVKYIRGLRRKDFPDCLKCLDRSFCAMCMVRNANEDPDGDPLKINSHFCKVAALNRKIVIDWKSKLKAAQ